MRNSKSMRMGGVRHLLHGASLSLAAVGMMLAAARAGAACGDPTSLKAGVVSRPPFLVQPGAAAEQAVSGLESATKLPDEDNNSIVGLWYVTYTTGGQLLYQSFDQWHSDGTELENPNLPPATGPLCVGVWKLVGHRTYRLHHVGWNFDINGNSLGTFTLNETNTVGPNGHTYGGTFDLAFYDVNGSLMEELTGTQAATRITVK